MTTTVFILATCLDRKLIENTLNVFKTIRTGFPTAKIGVACNPLDLESYLEVRSAVVGVSGSVWERDSNIPHGQWIESLIETQQSPFWICDTDITFHRRVEDWFEGSQDLFAGRYEPEFYEPWSKSQHVARLHPSLMWFNPAPLREAMAKWPGRHSFFETVETNLIRWHWVPVRGDLCFYDTCAGLHHALGGTAFTKEQNDCFSHGFAGTYRHLLGRTDQELKMHEQVCKLSNPY